MRVSWKVLLLAGLAVALAGAFGSWKLAQGALESERQRRLAEERARLDAERQARAADLERQEEHQRALTAANREQQALAREQKLAAENTALRKRIESPGDSKPGSTPPARA